MTTYELIKLLILLLVISAIGIGILTLYKKWQRILRNPASTVSQLLELITALKKQGKIMEEPPKSVSSMTKLMEPQVMRDFPEFSWDEFKHKAENMLTSVFLAIATDDITRLVEASDDVKKQVKNRLDENRVNGVTEAYTDVQIHQTEIANYVKSDGKCVITIQSAVGYVYTKHKAGKLIEGDCQYKTQTKYNIELVYIQDAQLAGLDNAKATVCPQCGAPVRNLGGKYCEYCGSGVTPLNIKVWSLHKFYEVDYNRK